MMYIEQTALQGKLHHKLNCRVLPYGTHNNSNTVAEAASELLARIRQAQFANGQRTLNIERLPPKESRININTNCNTSRNFAHLSNGDHTLSGHNIEEFKSVNHIHQNSFNQKSSHSVNELVGEKVEDKIEEEEEEEEEEYELIQVIDSEPLETSSESRTTIATPAVPIVETPLLLPLPPPTKSITDHTPTHFQPKLLSTGNDCSHFIIEIKEDTTDNITISDRRRQLAQLTDSFLQTQEEEADDEEFEYIVTRVPKKRRPSQLPPPPPPPPTLSAPSKQLKSQTTGQKNSLDIIESNLGSFCLNNNPLALEPIAATTNSQSSSFSTALPFENNLRLSLQQEVSRKRRRSIDDTEPYYTYSDEESEYTAAHQYSANQYDHYHYSLFENNSVAPVVEEDTAYSESIYYNYPRPERNLHHRDQNGQMGFDILNKIRNLLSLNKNSNQQTGTITNINHDTQRKRSYRESEIEVADPRQLKYRLIENRPSKLFHSASDDDDIQFVASYTYGRKQKQQEQLLLNGNFAKSSVNYKDNKNLLEMSNGLSHPPNDKVVGRKSIFSAPQITQHIIRNKNPTYADLEFSDEEDDDQQTAAVMKRSGNIEMPPPDNNAIRAPIPKIFNIPITKYRCSTTTAPVADDVLMMDSARSLPQTSLLASSSSSSSLPFLQSKSQMQIPTMSTRSDCDDDMSYMTKLKLGANQKKYRPDAYRNQQQSYNVRSGGNILNSSSHMRGKFNGRLLNGFASGPFSSNMWPPISGRSILHREKENDEREKYRQLLEKVAPQEYGNGVTAASNTISMFGGNAGNNKKLSATGSDMQHRRSALMLAAATSSSNSSPTMMNAKNISGQTKFQHVPFSSTINLVDDDDNDNDGGGDNAMPSKTMAGLKYNQQYQRMKNKIQTTIIIDDDDISDIVELGAQHDHYRPSKLNKSKNAGKVIMDLTKNDTTEKNKLPYVEPVNTLQERFNCSPHLKSNWYDEWRAKWSLRKQALADEVKETTKLAEKYTAERRLVEAELQESLFNIQITDDDDIAAIIDIDEPEREPEFIELTNEQKQRVHAALRVPADQVLVSKFNLNITCRDIHTLLGHNWLNDEVINFYMNLLTDRGERKHETHGLPSVYAMNTFFIPRLMQAGYTGVKRWTRKIDLFSKDVIPVPVHVGGVHWCMAVIHLKNRTIKYYDSMGTPNPNVLRALEQYLKDESLDKRKQALDTTNFQIESVQNVPRQLNGSDCGVFSCMFAEYITRDREITFTQENMEYFRQKMILEILQGELLQ